MADAGTDSFDRDLTLSLASFEQEALYEVDEALQRIDDGTYGVCELTGRPIPWKRLEAIPWTRFSIEAEAKLETLGTHPHIGLLRTIQPEGEESFEAPFDLQGESLSRWPTDYRASGLVSERMCHNGCNPDENSCAQRANFPSRSNRAEKTRFW
jgi:hypothetical protein